MLLGIDIFLLPMLRSHPRPHDRKSMVMSNCEYNNGLAHNVQSTSHSKTASDETRTHTLQITGREL